jgi:transporter family-2 protein
MTFLLLALALVAGSMLTVALSLNSQLGTVLGDSLLAGTVSFVIGTACLTAVSLVAEPWPSAATLAGTEWWAWTGGFFGALYLVSNIFFISRLGLLTAVGLAITGQMLASMVIDQFGLLGTPVEPLAVGSATGGLLTILGVGLIVRIDRGAASLAGKKLGLLCFALLIGAAIPAQAAVNAKLREEIAAPLLSGGISFAVGTVGLVVVLSAILAGTRQSLPRPTQAPWWIWLGGVFGAFYVDSSLVLVPLIGTSATIGFTVVGQQLASLLVDHFGLLHLPRRPVTGLRVVGVLLLLVGSSLIQGF